MKDVLVIGMGGIGSIYALLLKLGDPSIRISVVARSNYEAIVKAGISITSAKYGTHLLKPTAVYRTSHDAAAAGTVFDYVLCTTKSLPSYPASSLIAPVISPSTTIVLIQNGLGIEAPVHTAFPENTLISCAAYIGVWQTAPGFISHSALDRLELGTFPDLETVSGLRQQQDSTRLAVFMQTLSAGGCQTSSVPSVPAARWQKLIWNASFNCVCTITGLDTAKIAECPDAKAMVLAAMHEIIDAATASGYTLSRDLAAANWENTAKMGVAYKPSMMLDYEAGREMELDVILGSPIAEANTRNIKVPTLTAMKQILDILNWKTAQQRHS